MVRRAVLVFSALLAMARVAEGQATEDAFLTGHRDEVARNQPGRTVTLRTKDGRTAFQPREPIELVLSIAPASGVAVDPMAREHKPEISEIVFDRPQDVSTPLAALFYQDPEVRVSLGVSCCVAGAPPWSTTFELNPRHRVDRAGPLRLFVRSRPSHHSAHTGHETSNILTIQVEPRDLAWEASRARAASAVLEDLTASPEQVAAAIRSLESLGTIDGARVLLRRVDASGRRPSMTTLFTVDDRAAAVRLMEEELRRPERPIDASFVGALAKLARAARHPQGPPFAYDELLDISEHYSAMRARAFAAVLGLTPVIFAELDEGAKNDWNAFRGPVAPVLHHFPDEAAAAVRRLEADQIVWLLDRHGRRFAHSSLLPLLRELYARWDGLKTVALRPLCDVSPAECHALIRAELGRDIPRVSIDVMGRLPDATLPAMEEAWVRLLESSVRAKVLVAAAERLERFGTVATASRAAHAWMTRHENWTTDVDGALFAFLARVEPQLAARTLATAAKDPETMRGAGRGRALPLAIAEFEWNATVERFAIESLASDDYEVRSQAASALSAHGSSAGRPAIESALRQLRASWPRDDTEAAEDLEGELARVLVTAPGWHLTTRSRAVASAACVGDRCRNELSLYEAEIVEPIIRIAFPARDEPVAAEFTLAGVPLPSVPALIAKLRQYAAGTRFYFDPFAATAAPVSEAWTTPARQALFDEVKAAAGRHGIIVTPEYTLAK
jgi:hypothetical protein